MTRNFKNLLPLLALVATAALAACGGTDFVPGSTCSVDLPADIRAVDAEAAARSLGGSACGLNADRSLRAHLVRIEKGDRSMRAILRVVAEE